MKRAIARTFAGLAMVVLQALSLPAEAVFCNLVSYVCTEPAETRNINGLDVYRECWHYDAVYECGGGPALVDDCQLLRNQGCSQVGSTCETTLANGSCEMYLQTYSCQTASTQSTVVSCTGDMFCASGDCANQSYMQNTDFIQAYGGLAGLFQAGREFDSTAFAIFRGQDMRCDINIGGNIYNCCNFDGILNGLLSCDQEEEMLAQATKPQNRTIYVGEYCSSEIEIAGASWCIKRTRTYCVYGSLLARIIQQQGKPQLGLGFGTPENPDCSALSVDQFSSLDFNRIDFSEFTSQFAMPAGSATETMQRLQTKIDQGAN